MAKIDEYKESLNTLRVGSVLAFISIIGLSVILREIAKKTKEIGEL